VWYILAVPSVWYILAVLSVWYILAVPSVSYTLAVQLAVVFNATFNNISVISWQSVVLVGKTGVPG
jgi:hypothetical protein